MRIRLGTITAAIVALSMISWANAHEEQHKNLTDKPNIETLMTSALEGMEGVEVILSHVALPPKAALPKHWHPGEEFAYVLRGSVSVILDGEAEMMFSAGDVGKVPLKRIHSATAGDNGVVLLVFRVHQKGMPGRVLVQE